MLNPWGLALDDGVGVDEELSGAGDEGGVMSLSPGLEALVEGDEGRVPAEGGWQGGGEEGATEAGAPPAM